MTAFLHVAETYGLRKYNHKPIFMPKLSVSSLQMADDSNPTSLDVTLFQKHSCALIFQDNSKHGIPGLSNWNFSLRSTLLGEMLLGVYYKSLQPNYLFASSWSFIAQYKNNFSPCSLLIIPLQPTHFLLWVQFHFFPFLVPLGLLWLPQPAQCQYRHWSCALRSTAQQRPSTEHGEAHLPPRGSPTTAASAWGLWRRVRRRQCLVAYSAGESSKRDLLIHASITEQRQQERQTVTRTAKNTQSTPTLLDHSS